MRSCEARCSRGGEPSTGGRRTSGRGTRGPPFDFDANRDQRFFAERRFAGLRLAADFLAAGLRFAADFRFAGLRLAADFLAAGLRFAADFRFAGLRLAADFLAAGLRFAADFRFAGFRLAADFLAGRPALRR